MTEPEASNPEKPKKPDPELAGYRQWLVEAEQKSQESFDKTVLSLSGGALGVSFVFLKDVIGDNVVLHPGWLLLSWVCWAASSLAVLASFLLSHKALRRAIEQVDAGTIRTVKPGGWLTTVTSFLNTGGAVLFFVGVCTITVFVKHNLASKESHNVQETSSNAAAQTNAAPSASTTPATESGATPVRQGGPGSEETTN